MFDFDVITGPSTVTRPVPPAAAPVRPAPPAAPPPVAARVPPPPSRPAS